MEVGLDRRVFADKALPLGAFSRPPVKNIAGLQQLV
jgi:hypothetical protein